MNTPTSTLKTILLSYLSQEEVILPETKKSFEKLISTTKDEKVLNRVATLFSTINKKKKAALEKAFQTIETTCKNFLSKDFHHIEKSTALSEEHELSSLIKQL